MTFSSPFVNDLLIYLLCGVVIGFLIEASMRLAEHDLNMKERLAIIVFWPIMVCVFIYHFIKGLTE